MNSNFSNTGFFSWLWKHKIYFAVTQIITVAAVYVITLPFFIRPQYRSTAVIYPYNVSNYSTESPTEQMLEFLRSVDIKNEVIKDLGLIKHYKIDTTGKYWYANLIDDFDGNVFVDPTNMQAIEINAQDVSQDTAYLIAKDMLKCVNAKIHEVQAEKSLEVAHMLKKQMDAKKQEVDSLAAISRTMSVQYGLIDDENQAKEVLRSYYEMMASGKNGKAFDEVSAQVKNIEEKGEIFKEVNRHLKAAMDEYDQEDTKYRIVVSDMNKPLTYTNLISKPVIPDKKVFPIRWFLTLLSCISVFVFSALLLILIEKKNKTLPGDK